MKHLVYQKTDKVFQFGSYNGFINYIVSKPFCGFIVFETSLVLPQIQFIRIYHVLIATIEETFGVLVTPDQCVNQLLIMVIYSILIYCIHPGKWTFWTSKMEVFRWFKWSSGFQSGWFFRFQLSFSRVYWSNSLPFCRQHLVGASNLPKGLDDMTVWLLTQKTNGVQKHSQNWNLNAFFNWLILSWYRKSKIVPGVLEKFGYHKTNEASRWFSI